MPFGRILPLASFGAALIGLLAVGQPASAQVRPQVKAGFGLVIATFALPEGAVTAYLPDDVATGETFSGTVEGPDGFVLTFGEQRARTGEPFLWTVPTGEPRQRFVITLLDRQGSERARVWLQTGAAAQRDAAFRFPPLVQAGKPLPIRGPLDGDFRTTRVEINGSAASPLAESIRRVIVRAPSNLMGPTSATLTKAGIEHRGAMRSLSIEMAPPAGGASPAERELTVKGVSGIDRDVPLLIAGDHLYLRSTDVAGQPTFTVRREFSGVRADSEAELVIPQSLREEVAVVLRTPPWSRDVEVARQHGDALDALDFDALPVAEALLSDSALGRAAMFAMLAADQRRALPLILASMPDSGIDVQYVGLLWFLDNHRDARQANAEAREAALRVLARILSTATAQLAVYVVGVAGSDLDLPMLERLYDNGRSGSAGLKDASRAALVRLGSRKHLEGLRAELSRPLPPDATYGQGVRLSEVLRTAAFAGHPELVPAVCGHINDPVVVEIDIYAYPDRSAAEALNAIVDGTTPLQAPKRSLEEWKTYCKRAMEEVNMRLATVALLVTLASSAAWAQVNAGDQKPEAIVPFNMATVTTFTLPWRLAFLPDGRMLVTEKVGPVWLVTQQGQKTLVANTPSVYWQGQNGMLGVYVSPTYATDQRIYLTYAEPGDYGGGLALARARLNFTATGVNLQNVEVLWRQLPRGRGGQEGAAVAFSPDGQSLFLTVGDRQRFTPAQDPDQPVGKILRLTLDGKPAPGNPNFGTTGAATIPLIDPPTDTEAAKTAKVVSTYTFPGPNNTPAETWTTGHRTPYGLAFSPSGELWEIEHGPRGGDELNLIEKGKNYGWPLVGFAPNYNGVPIPHPDTRPDLAKPAIYWVPVIAPGNLMFYRGTQTFPQWDGNGFIGGLGTRSLTRVILDGKGGAKLAERWDVGKRIRDVAEAPDGSLWMLEDASVGALIHVTPK